MQHDEEQILPSRGQQESWRRGSVREETHTAMAIAGLLFLQALLLVWWLLEKEGLPKGTHDLDQPLLHILGFLTASTTTLVIIQAERFAERPPLSVWRARLHLVVSWIVVWGTRLCGLAAFITWGCYLVRADPGGSAERWARSAVLIGGLLAVASLVITAGRLAITRVPGRRTEVASRASVTPQASGSGAPPDEPGLTMAFSGGGIRAATFALGAWNAVGELQREAPDEVDAGPKGPRLVAVSGGSYLAAAIALLRTFVIKGDVAETCDGDAPDWDVSYAVSSKEMTRLRRHTRDLVEPRSQLLGGLLTLLTGSLVNLLVLVGFAWVVAWLLSWLYTTTGILEVERTADDTEARLSLNVPDLKDITVSGDAPWIHPAPWAATWLVPGVALVAVAIIILARMGVERRVDKGKPVAPRWRWVSPALPPTVGLALVYVATAVGLPWLLFAFNQLAVHNAPTQTAATVISAAGFANEEFCRAGVRDSLASAYESANARAALSIGTAQTSTAGSCGREFTVTVKLTAEDEVGYTDAELDRIVNQVIPTTGSSPGLDVSTGATALLTLVTTLALAIRRANATDSIALNGWRGKLRKLFTSWLPFGALALVLGWLLLSWTFESTLQAATPTSTLVPLALAGAALLAAVFVDANATALHSYYRQRLSSAWAVGRRLDGDVAQLPVTDTYNFSQLSAVPLHVVTTANIRAYTQAATRRGGLAMVFSPSAATLVDGSDACSVPMKEYEDSAGPGRVSIMAAVATSGAAVSPMAGRYSYNIAPFRLLLTLFNVRVGTWVANPRWGTRPPRAGRPRPWLIARPGAAQVFAEAMGKSSINDRWLYLSDGGHLDNTGLVEAVRLHPRGGRIIVIDASNDAIDSWSAVGDAIGVIRADLGIELRCAVGGSRDPDSPQPATREVKVEPTKRLYRATVEKAPEPPADAHPYMRVYEAHIGSAFLEVLVVKAVRPSTSADALPESVRSFTLRTTEFPRSSTTRQDFGDVEFEAYRALGEHYMRLAWEQWKAHRSTSTHPSHADWPARS